MAKPTTSEHSEQCDCASSYESSYESLDWSSESFASLPLIQSLLESWTARTKLRIRAVSPSFPPRTCYRCCFRYSLNCFPSANVHGARRSSKFLVVCFIELLIFGTFKPLPLSVAQNSFRNSQKTLKRDCKICRFFGEHRKQIEVVFWHLSSLWMRSDTQLAWANFQVLPTFHMKGNVLRPLLASCLTCDGTGKASSYDLTSAEVHLTLPGWKCLYISE